MNRIYPLAIGVDSEAGLAHLMVGSDKNPKVTVWLHDGDTWSTVLDALCGGRPSLLDEEVPR
jgi:hypothetical protein